MTPQPHNPISGNPDARIDHVLDALRSTEPPAGLEARIAARIAQATEARTLARTGNRSTAPFFAVILTLGAAKGKEPRIPLAQARLFAFAATALILLLTLSITLHLHHNPQTIAQWNPTHTLNPQPTTHNPQPFAPTTPTTIEGAGLQSRHHPAAMNAALAAEPPSTPAPPTDPDALALAETLAPSHPAPPMPLTTQEAALVRATRQGEPIEVAELGILRDTNLRALAAAREHASLRQYIHGLLGPLAAAQAFESTSPDATQPATPSDSAPPPQSK